MLPASHDQYLSTRRNRLYLARFALDALIIRAMSTERERYFINSDNMIKQHNHIPKSQSINLNHQNYNMLSRVLRCSLRVRYDIISSSFYARCRGERGGGER